MPKSALTGSRIRDRRTALGLKQADLARDVGISASYLNLIEHNRRKIGGKVLVAIARALGVDVPTLSEGAEEALLESLREASAMSRSGEAEVDQTEEFVSRFPGWAQLLAAQWARMMAQDRTIEALNDRLNNDPLLAEAMHGLLSNITAIRSSASILVETPDIEPEWRARFHRNLFEESSKLVSGGQALVDYFEQMAGAQAGQSTPLEQLEGVLRAHAYHLPMLEAGPDAPLPQRADMEAVLDDFGHTFTREGRALCVDYLAIYARLARRIPLEEIVLACRSEPDPSALAQSFDVPLTDMLHRLALLPADRIGVTFGLVVADPSGALLFRKPLEGFPVPQFGAACTLWPVFEAFSRPLSPIHATLTTPTARTFESWSVVAPVDTGSFDAPSLFRSTMLFRASDTGQAVQKRREIGTACRICVRAGCPARREPSILSG